MKLLMVMAGGTGGHVYPALAIAKALQEKGVGVVWLGTREGLEARVVPSQGFDIEWIEIKGVRGTGIVKWLKLPLQLSRAVLQALAIFKRRRPDVLLSMGGFVAGPGGIAGRLKNIPLILHEANAIAGLTNKALARVADTVMCAFPQTKGLPPGAIVVGNPVRADIVNLHKASTPLQQGDRRLNLLIVGGSQGAASFNQIVPPAVKQIDEVLRPQIRHQSGKGHSTEVVQRYREAAVEAEVHEYLEDMAEHYTWADLILCRAGAMTVAEITTVGLPALIVPYPYAAGDHQLFNARYLQKHQAARLLLHKDLSAERLARELSELLADTKGLAQMAENSLRLATIDATQRATSVCEQVLYA